MRYHGTSNTSAPYKSLDSDNAGDVGIVTCVSVLLSSVNVEAWTAHC